MRTSLLLLAVACYAQPVFATDEKTANANVGRKIDNFSLRDFRGKPFEIAELKDKPAVVVAFLGIECPLANLYAPRLVELEKAFQPRGVAFIAINANAQDSVTEIGHWVKKHGIEFPVLKDVGNKVADHFAAERTPEVFVLDRDRVIRYRGRVDDQYGVGYHRVKPATSFLTGALEAVLAGTPVTIPITDPEGCLIGRVREPKPDSDVTYSNQIARILQDRCILCHREGEIAPFALTEYDEVAGWASMIDEVVRDGRMPPWHASEKHGQFANDSRLSQKERETIKSWVRAGAPEGDPKDLPAPRQFTPGWQIAKPDLILPITQKPFKVKATGDVAYQHFVVDPGFKEDKWVRAAECRPGNRSVVHHIIAFIQAPNVGPEAGRSVKSLWLASTAPGAVPLNLPEGQAKFVPAGSKFLFQVHYATNGTAQEDVSHLGIVFADAKKVEKEVGTWRAANLNFTIPPNVADHVLTATKTFREDMILLSMFPHMHLRGKSFRYEAEFPGGQREILLDIPRYDFGWQNSYDLASPRLLPAGTKLICTAVFDNSTANPNNPNPNATVHWGDQTSDEMMAGHFDVIRADQDLRNGKPTVRRTDRFLDRQKGTEPASDKLLVDLETAIGATALDQEKLRSLTRALADRMPQLDRIDVAIVRDGKLVIVLDADIAETDPPLLAKGTKAPVAKLALPEYAKGDKAIVHDRLAKETAGDLKLMAGAFASSMHVPVKIGGEPGTVNFWSEEGAAFPPLAADMLRPIAELIAKHSPSP